MANRALKSLAFWTIATVTISLIVGGMMRKSAHGQTLTGYTAILNGPGTASANGYSCALLEGQLWFDTSGNILSICHGGQQVSTEADRTMDWQLQPGLFSTGALKGNVYYVLNASIIKGVVSRVEGSIICVTAPTVVVMDLGTSASTAYASATTLYSQATSTSNIVVSNIGLSVAVPAGHFVGFALSGGSCVTPPTLSTSVTLQ